MIMTLDPTGHYSEKKISLAKLVDAIGILPDFVHGPEPTMSANMEENYQFFHSWSDPEGASVADGCFLYPGDPAQYPLARLEGGEETIYIYPHSFVAVCTEGDLLKWTRMD